MNPQPLICVNDVEASSQWYQRLLGCQSAHGGRDYERLVIGGKLVLQLHRWDVGHHHGPIGDPKAKPYGNGVLLWFEIHDFDAAGWTMVGFIFMVDEFRCDNGPTRFVPGSHEWSNVPGDLVKDPTADYDGQVQACGPAGSMAVYNGSVWHGHAANSTDKPRRSIQGSYIRREAQSGINLPARMRSETLARISPLAKYLLAVD